MLITTHSGIVVNSNHIAYIAMQKSLRIQRELEGDPAENLHFKVLLCLASGMLVIAARELSETAARFLRKEIATRWAEGASQLHVCEVLHRHQEGGYYAQDITTKLTLVEGGD